MVCLKNFIDFHLKNIYFFLADDRFQSDNDDMKDFKFVRYLTKEKVKLIYIEIIK